MSLNNYAVNGTNLSTIFYHDTLRLNSNLTRYTGLSIGQRANDISNNSVRVVPAETKYKISGVDICNNIFFQYVETDISTNITIPDWCTHISAVLIGGGGGGGGGGGAANNSNTDVDKDGGSGGGGGSGSINAHSNIYVANGKKLRVTVGNGGSSGEGGTNGTDFTSKSGGPGGPGSETKIELLDTNDMVTNTLVANPGSGGVGGTRGDTKSNGVDGAGGAGGTVGNNGGFSGSTGGSGIFYGNIGGITKFTSYFTQNLTILYGKGGTGGASGDPQGNPARSAAAGGRGISGYVRIYFLILTHNVLTFTSSGSFTFTSDKTIDNFLIVGAGGNPWNGGGGGGCVGIKKPGSSFVLSADNYSVIIGDNNVIGNDGVTSIIRNSDNTVVASANPGSGGDRFDGGSSGTTTDTTTTTIDYSISNPGGAGNYYGATSNYEETIGGGGGGAGGIGGPRSGAIGGIGGSGIQFIDGNTYGMGGNGKDRYNPIVAAATANTGNGGSGPISGGGRGGSGIVKIYYL